MEVFFTAALAVMPRGIRWSYVGIGALLLLINARPGSGQDAGGTPSDVVPVGVFSKMDPSQERPEGWRLVTTASVYKKTVYDLIRDEQKGVVVRAQTQGRSASPLATDHSVDLTEHPILEWRWKVEQIIEESNVRAADSNSAPARVIVEFAYNRLNLRQRLKVVAMKALGWEEVPSRSISYVWANNVDRDTVFTAPHLNWVREVVVRSGTTHVGTWTVERRNVRADYRRIFGEAPPPVEGIAIGTGTAHTDETITSYYGDIVFRSDAPDSVVADTTLHVANDGSENR